VVEEIIIHGGNLKEAAKESHHILDALNESRKIE